MKIAILEDNEARQEEMQRCLRDRFHQHGIVVFAQSKEMVAYLKENLSDVLVISLDHDLELTTQQDGTLVDGGTGREVADYLAQCKPSCPIVIHTTNTPAGDSMEFLLRDAGWDIRRVHPWGDLEWISSKWIRTLRDAVVGSAQPRAGIAKSAHPKSHAREADPNF
ncbi:MAG TPA: cyclic-phosphate processing receiver domain-containing protein [Gemmataceae bacterium]|nr:cyclic-phosphate processing receiver domain-containing protein [Gemmataceae bacterium]